MGTNTKGVKALSRRKKGRAAAGAAAKRVNVSERIRRRRDRFLEHLSTPVASTVAELRLGSFFRLPSQETPD
jgi:hypothetical protein